MSCEDGQRAHAVIQDTAEPLGQIRCSIDSHPHAATNNIISAVLDIQQHAVTRESWIKSLECLYLDTDESSEPSGRRRRGNHGRGIATADNRLLRRTYLNPVSDALGGRDYIAVSYTWDLSEEEKGEHASTCGNYHIESRRGEWSLPSEVRDLVWERVLRFSEHVKCKNIWIDRECVEQDDEAEQETAIQNMHLVYSLSKRPVAVLSRTIKTAEELDLLISLMLGDVRLEEEEAVLELIDSITASLWWTRAWTFQEDYKASTRMTLMIPHDCLLEDRKCAARDFSNRPLLGNLEGEICIKSADFRRRATEFCILYKKKRPASVPVCAKILETAGKYNVLLREQPGLHAFSRSMSPTIFADIGRRGITTQSDRLAIAANCCSYTTRLDTFGLNASNRSLSLSMLALYLLNGEIIENRPKQCYGTLKDNIFKYLAKQSLSSFRPPVDEELTFIKSCRFIDPILTPEGTITRGHLWKLGKVIRRRPMKRDKYNTLSPLETLATELHYKTYGATHEGLATSLWHWTQESAAAALAAARRGFRPAAKRPWEWREWMADEVEAALLEGKALRLASLVRPDDGQRAGDEHGAGPYRAIFVSDAAADEELDSQATLDSQDAPLQTSYVFTAARPAKPGRLGDIHKHVSLEVDIEWPDAPPSEEEDSADEAESGGEATGAKAGDKEGSEAKKERKPVKTPAAALPPPKLFIRRWINGLCFFDDAPQRPVLFPWPPALLAEATEEEDTGDGPASTSSSLTLG
ncbi:hypothetical protein F5Y15DRAFT_406490 [Xylariaceae sp. FL0016]|nr:hypothetical protein F5Y15DRAFT_406490 [Xylariaceae sp. FL0016]